MQPAKNGELGGAIRFPAGFHLRKIRNLSLCGYYGKGERVSYLSARQFFRQRILLPVNKVPGGQLLHKYWLLETFAPVRPGIFLRECCPLPVRERCGADGNRFYSGRLFGSGIDGFQNQFHRAFQSVIGRVDAQVVEACIAQFLPGVVQAVGAAAGVHDVHGPGCPARFYPIVFNNALHARGPVRMKENTEQVGPPFQDEVGAAAHDDACLTGRNVPDDFALCQEGGVFRGHFLRRVGVVLGVKFVQKAAGKLLFVLADVVRSEAAPGGREVHQFRVVESDAQLFRQHFPDGMAAGTVFPVNGNDQRGVRSISGRLCQRRKLACCSGARQPFQEPVRPEDVPVEKRTIIPTRTAATTVPSRMPVSPDRKMREQARPMQTSVQSIPVLRLRIPIEEFDEGQAHAFPCQKNGIRLNLKKDAESDYHAAEQAENNGPQVSVRFQRRYDPHGKSVRKPKIKAMGIWSRCAGRNCLFSRAACTATKLRCMRMVTVPMVRGNARLST